MFASASWAEVMGQIAFGSLLVAIAFTPLSESIKNIAFTLALVSGVLNIIGRKPLRLVVTRVGWAHFFFFLVAFLSASQAIDHWQGFRGAWDVFRYFLFFLLVVNLCRTESRVHKVLGVFIGSAALGAMIGLGVFGYNVWVKWAGGEAPRLLAVHVHSLGHPNHTATYLLMMIALAVGARIYLPLSRGIRMGLDFALVFLVAAQVLTYSRSAFATLILFLIFLVGYLRRLKVFIAVVGVVLISTTLWGVIGGPGKKRLGEILQPWKSPAVRERLILWSTLSVGVVRDRPILGAGPRNFNQIDKRRYGVGDSYDYYNHAHSLYFSVLTEMGLLGLGSLILWFAAGLSVWWRAVFGQPSNLGKALLLGYFGTFMALTVSGVITTTLHTEGAIAYSSTVALLVAWTRLGEAGLASESLPQEQCR
jgi:O-antigen ligase